MSIKYGKKNDAYDFCDACKINKGCSATKTDVWFFKGNKYCSECLEGQVMSEALQPECDEEQRELRESIRRECDYMYNPYDDLHR